MEIAMRRLLLATTAAAALVAGSSLGLAQDSGKGGAPQAAPPGGVHEKTPGGPAQGKGTSANPAQGKGAPGGMTQGERPNQPGARDLDARQPQIISWG